MKQLIRLLAAGACLLGLAGAATAAGVATVAEAGAAAKIAVAADSARATEAAATAAGSGEVRLLFVGDVMLDDGPGRAVAAGRDPFAAFADLFDAADVRIGNLECPIATGGKALDNKIYTFRANPRVVDVLHGRFDAMSVANNHSGDYGQEAFLETLALLDIAGVAAFGGGRDLAEAHAPHWIEKNGLRIALLAYNEYKPRSFEAGPDWPGVAWSEDSHVLRDIRAARAAGADVVIPFMHWGWEREREPNERQRALARLMIDAGADAVVGGHPHVTQGSETYRGKPIVYSLGNFVFDGFDAPAEREGWLLRMTVGRDGVVAWDVITAYMDRDGLPQRTR
jgi:poly-gamma-glutamate capsule biosynthesis protein CapA/YwtB (metallophosphatase superfamily)